MNAKPKWWKMMDTLPGERARVVTARWSLFVYAVLGMLGVILHILYRHLDHLPIDWYYQTMSLGIGLSALAALYQLRTSLIKGMLTFVIPATLCTTMLLIHVLPNPRHYYPVLFMFHIGIFSIGLILGFPYAIRYTIIIAGLWSLIGLLSKQDSSDIILPIALAFVAAVPSKVVEELIDESTTELSRINDMLQAENVERQRAEEALRKSEELYRTLIEASPDPIILCNLAGNVLLSNPQTAQLYGCADLESVRGRNAFDFVAPEDRQRAAANMRKTMEDGMIQNIEYKLMKHDGSPFPAELSAALITDSEGHPEAYIGIVHDITGRKQAEEATRRRNRELTVLNTIANVTAQSHDVEHLLNVTLEEILKLINIPAGWIQLLDEKEPQSVKLITQQGLSHDEYEDIETTPVFTELAAHIIQANQPILIEDSINIEFIKIETPIPTTWATRPIALAGFPIMAKDEVLGMLGICNTQLQSLTAQDMQLLVILGHQIGMAVENVRLNQIATEVEILREVDRMRSELISNVSHELRTPLGLIKFLCTTLLRDDVDFDKSTHFEFLHDIEEETDKLEELVNSILDLSHIENGRFNLKKAPIALDEIVKAVIAKMTLRAPVHHIMHKFPPEPLMAFADAKRIEDVIRNLLDNAIKYSPNGGTITIEGYNSGNNILLQVSDEGIGIPKDELEKIFERFYRVQNEQTRGTSGTGLGLAVCQSIIKAHGGNIWVESTVGKGSTFYCTLPGNPRT